MLLFFSVLALKKTHSPESPTMESQHLVNWSSRLCIQQEQSLLSGSDHMQKHKQGRWGLELISIFDLVHLTDSKQVTRGKTVSCNKNRCASVLHKDTWFVANSFHTPSCNNTMLLNLTASKCFARTCFW